MSLGQTRNRQRAIQGPSQTWTTSKGPNNKNNVTVTDGRRAQSTLAPDTVGHLFSVHAMVNPNSHVIRYGTTRSLPEHHHPDNDRQHQAMTNGRASTGKRLYSSKTQNAPRKPLNASEHFKRTILERKEDAIAFFDIETKQSPYYQYRPGEDISGAVHMDVRNSIEIKFVELLIVGQGTLSVHKPKANEPTVLQETYLYKSAFTIGTGDATWSSVLTPGHYMSQFRFRLPKDLPSSIRHGDHSSGFTLDISYYIKARICDSVGSTSTRSISSTNQLIKVLISKKQMFGVQRHFDLNLVPDASMPVVHNEEIFLSCAGSNKVEVSLSLERAVFLAGDDIRLQLAASLPHSQRIKSVCCKLEQHLKLDRPAEKVTFTLAHTERKDPQLGSNRTDYDASYDLTIPTKTDLVTSFLHGCQMVRIAYSLDIEIRFAPAGGKLALSIPLGIGPCAEPIYADKISSRKAVPIFNRPTRFPCFSPSAGKTSLQMDRSSKSSQSINISTKYSNSFWGQCFLCCFSAADRD